MEFKDFTLQEQLQQGIDGAGYVNCTPVQSQVLQNSLEGRDLYVQSQTGTGKTAAYLVSVIQELLSRGEVSGKKALVMVPTRELAVQVQEEAEKLSRFTSLKCASFYGGVGYDRQISTLKAGVDIIIGTPGRVIDLTQGGQMDLSSVAFLVIDEADRMFDMGFYPDLRTLIKVLPPAEKRQTMLFSATLNSYVKNLAWEYTRNPAEITIEAENITVDEIDQLLLHVSSDSKMKLLLGIIGRDKPESLIVFCNTKRSCEVVAKRLRHNGIDSEFIIGDLPQKKRLEIMDRFKAGKVGCLVATDVAARGIDVNDLAMVINYDLPNEAENYVHRIGRTARAGKSGKAYTFCSEQDVYSLPPIERYIGRQIPSQVAEESMMVEDKSAGTYIRTDNYREDYNDRSEYGRRKQSEYNARRGGSRGSGNKGRGRYSSKNENAAREYRRDRRVFSPDEEAALASMSTDERMKLYREKFAPKSLQQPSGKSSGSNAGGSGKGGRKNGGKKSGKKPQSNVNSRRTAQNKPVQSQNQTQTRDNVQSKKQKKGLLSRIRTLFGKK
ncbi:MAG: DEAD/DEAH box helicase [Treponema sp.]|nr:DEAD/DEAH box helicase [Treponema sp.]